MRDEEGRTRRKATRRRREIETRRRRERKNLKPKIPASPCPRVSVSAIHPSSWSWSPGPGRAARAHWRRRSGWPRQPDSEQRLPAAASRKSANAIRTAADKAGGNRAPARRMKRPGADSGRCRRITLAASAPPSKAINIPLPVNGSMKAAASPIISNPSAGDRLATTKALERNGQPLTLHSRVGQ